MHKSFLKRKENFIPKFVNQINISTKLMHCFIQSLNPNASTLLMYSEEALNIASQLFSELTGKELTDLQSDLLKASWENQTYDEFAKAHSYCCDYVKDEGSKLWNLLSQALGKKVTKKNFRQVLQQYHYKQHNILYSEI